MKNKHKAIIRSQARRVRKAARYISSLSTSYGSQYKDRVREIKITNGQDYDPICAKQLALAASDAKAARLFRCYMYINQVTIPEKPALVSCYDFRMLSLILLAKNKKINRDAIQYPDIYKTK